MQRKISGSEYKLPENMQTFWRRALDSKGKQNGGLNGCVLNPKEAREPQLILG